MIKIGSTFGIVLTGEKVNSQGKTYLCATLCTTNPTWNAYDPLCWEDIS